MNAIIETTDWYGNITMKLGNLEVFISPNRPGATDTTFSALATASGASLRAFSGKSYKSAASAKKAASAWLLSR